MQLSICTLEELTIVDEPSFRHVSLYAELKQKLRDDRVPFAVAAPNSALAHEPQVTLLNLAFWRPGDVAEILVDDILAADQLTHCAWHHLAGRALGEEARSSDGLLFAEALASAFDLYLVGRLLGHAPDSDFLETQVPAMTDAALASGWEKEDAAELFERASAEPERSFELLRELLFDAASELSLCESAMEAAGVLERHADHPMAGLLHHYELVTWVLYARCYGSPAGPRPAVRALDAQLRSAQDALVWLEAAWLGPR
jgi:hypothetical protein